MKTRIYLDIRHLDKKGQATLKVVITKRGTIGMIPLFKIAPSQWKNGEVVNHPKAVFLNSIVRIRMGEIEKELLDMSASGALSGKTATEISHMVLVRIDPDLALKESEARCEQEMEDKSFALYFKKHIARYDKAGTRQLYEDTYNKIESYCKAEGIDFQKMSFEDINKHWLESFERFCLVTQKQNSASRHLRDIRAVLNAAIDDERCTNYPFRKFKIKKQESKDKSYSSEELRQFFKSSRYAGGEEEAIDIFKLMFCLIGINGVDLANASPIIRGRLEYDRMKTGKHYSIMVEPEAQEIIEKYKGNSHLINILERVPNYKTYFSRMRKRLRKVGLVRAKGKKNTGKACLPDICPGSARTSWATIAQEELGIPREVIAAALGHHTVDVTSTYLRTDWKMKIDKANRKVLDWVFYEKKTRVENEE